MLLEYGPRGVEVFNRTLREAGIDPDALLASGQLEIFRCPITLIDGPRETIAERFDPLLMVQYVARYACKERPSLSNM